MQPVSNQPLGGNPYTPDNNGNTPPYVEPSNGNSKRVFSVSETIFAWLSLLFGYLFCRVFPISQSPLGGFLLTLFMFVSALVVIKIKGFKITPKPIIAFATAILISASLFLTANPFLHFFSYSYALVVFCYFIFIACGNSVKAGFSDFIVADFIKALFVMPFCSFGSMFKAMFSGKGKGSGKTFLKVLIGIGLTLIPTMIVFGLLSYDNDFTNLFNNIFDFDFDKIWSHIGSLILGVPVGLYIYGLFVSSVDKKCSSVLNEESSSKVIYNMRIAPAVTIIAAVVPLLFIYVVFFISQWKYYISGFTGVLPEGFIYSAYAREGFFQLCVVSVINLVAITAVIMFMKRKNKADSFILKTIVILFSVFTLILISTAVAKMVMYINTYGLTPKRVYATWLMSVIAVLFILISLKMFVRKLKVVAISLVAVVTMFAIISLPNTDAFIARYNVERYINGSLDSIDLDAMEDLGTSAIPSLVDLKLYLNKNSNTEYESQLNTDIYNYFEDIIFDMKYIEKNIFSYTIPDMIAERELKESGYY